MSYPEHPDTIILKNKFYPKGLREIDIWEYYQRVKAPLLREVQNRDLMFWVMVDMNKPVVIRKGKLTKYIRLNSSNYDNIIHGRVISIHSAMRRTEDVAIIDIDIDNFKKAQVAAIDIYEFVMANIPIIKTASIKFTGKNSFHVFMRLRRKINVDSIRFLLRKFLIESDLVKKYTIEHKRFHGIPNLDLTPNKFRGSYITLHSLSIWGLRCMEVDHGRVLSFNPYKATITRSKMK